MPHQKHVLIIGLTLFLLALGASIECRADGIWIEAPPAVSVALKNTFLCTWHLSPCVNFGRPSQTSAHHDIRQGRNEYGSPHLAFGTSIAKVTGQTSDEPVSGGGINFTVASMGAGIATHNGRLALNMMFDSHYHGAAFNSEAPFGAMQVSLNYTRAW